MGAYLYMQIHGMVSVMQFFCVVLDGLCGIGSTTITIAITTIIVGLKM